MARRPHGARGKAKSRKGGFSALNHKGQPRLPHESGGRTATHTKPRFGILKQIDGLLREAMEHGGKVWEAKDLLQRTGAIFDINAGTFDLHGVRFKFKSIGTHKIGKGGNEREVELIEIEKNLGRIKK